MDKKEELFSRIREYENRHNEFLRRFTLFLGRRLKKMNNPVGRFVVAKITTKLLAFLIVRYKLFEVEKKDNPSVVEIALNWLKPSIFFRIPYEIEEVSENRVVILRPECTMGLDSPKYQKLCRASMNMDIEIIKKLGGKLTVTETILEGAKSCKHIIEKAK